MKPNSHDEHLPSTSQLAIFFFTMRALVLFYTFSLFLVATAPQPPNHPSEANSGLNVGHQSQDSDASSVTAQGSEPSPQELEGGSSDLKEGDAAYIVCDGKVWSPDGSRLADKHSAQSDEPPWILYEIRTSKMKRNPWYGRGGLKFRKKLLSAPKLVPYPSRESPYFHFEEGVEKGYVYVLIQVVVHGFDDDIDATHEDVEDLFREFFPNEASQSISKFVPYEDREWCRSDPNYKQQALTLPKSESKTQKHKIDDDKGLVESNKKPKIGGHPSTS